MPLAYFGYSYLTAFSAFWQNFDLSRNLSAVVAFLIYHKVPLCRFLHAANLIARLIVVLN